MDAFAEKLQSARLPVEFTNGESVEFSRLLTPKEAEKYRSIARNHRRITPRQAEFLRLAADGYSNKMIAKKFSVALQTVKNTFSNLYARTGAINRANAVRKGLICE
jgi:DNA-binding NarL/FixJ family response regulator